MGAHQNAVEGAAHGDDGGLVGAVAITTAHEAGASQGGGLGDADDFESQVAVQ
jgi:hypothetical protein